MPPRDIPVGYVEHLVPVLRRVGKLEAAGPGGGAAVWGGITGTLSAQTDLQAALNGKQAAGSYAPLSHAHVIADTTGLQAALDGKAALAHTHAQSDVTGLVAALAAIPVVGTAVITVPNNAMEWTETVAAAGVAPAKAVVVSIGAHTDADENNAEDLDLNAISAVAGTNQITVTASFREPQAGPIRLNWMAA